MIYQHPLAYLLGVEGQALLRGWAGDRRRLPTADFLLGEIEELPIADHSVDVVTCGLALSHLPSLGPAMVEFARALRPGGHLVVSDVSPGLILRGSVVQALGPAGEPGLVPTFRHSAGDYLQAALSAGLEIRRYVEPLLEDHESAPDEDTARTEASAADDAVLELGPWSVWPWSLMPLIPEAIKTGEGPMTVVWHLQLPN